MRRAAVCVVLLCLIAACDSDGRETAWAPLAPMETARSEHPAVALDSSVIVIGGLAKTPAGEVFVTSSVESYDPASDSWQRLEDLPERRHHSAAATIGDRLFVVGGFSEFGFDAVDDVWELVDGSWEVRSSLPVPVGAAAAVELDGFLYLVGGTPTGGLFRYDPAEDEWKRLSSLSNSREHVGAVVHNREIWAIGGRWGDQMLATTEIYSPDSDDWRAGPEMNEARSGFGATTIDGRIYVAGGEVFNPTLALDATEVLTETGSWLMFEPLPTGLHGVPLAAIDGQLYLPGGSDLAGAVSNTGDLLVIDPASYSATGP